MVTAALILVLLTIAASLASWLFGQWLAGRIRISGAALAVGGAGALLMSRCDWESKGRWLRRSLRFVTPQVRGDRYAISPAK